MTVQELIQLLKQYPPHLEIVYKKYSEHVKLQSEQIEVAQLCNDRGDGWVPNARPDRPTKQYLRFPGN